MRLNEVMNRQVLTVERATSLRDAREILSLREVRHLVVVENHCVVGILSQRELGPGEGLVEDRMITDVVTATPTTTVREAANLMRGHRIGCLPVLVGGRLAGIVTVTDMLELIGSGKVVPMAHKERPPLRLRKPKLSQALPRAPEVTRRRSR